MVYPIIMSPIGDGYNGLLLGSLLDKRIYYWIYHIEPFKPGLGSYAAVGCVGPDETSFTPSGWEWIVSLCAAHGSGDQTLFNLHNLPFWGEQGTRVLNLFWPKSPGPMRQKNIQDYPGDLIRHERTRVMNMMEVCCSLLLGFPKTSQSPTRISLVITQDLVSLEHGGSL